MIDLLQIPEEKLGQSQRFLKRQFIERGWRANVLYIGSAHVFITRDDGKKIHIFGNSSPNASYAAASLINDKFATYQLLKNSGIPQLDTIKVSNIGSDEALEFLNKKMKVVVKPIDGGHGKGITVNVSNKSDLEKAIELALENTKGIHSAIIQEQYNHEMIYDLRISIVDYKYTGAIRRVAARVFGDGEKTVRQLIEMENSSERRGRAYHSELASIDIERSETYLKEEIDFVPNAGEEVQVLGIANYGAGGELFDVTDDIPNWLIEYSEKVARECELPVAGVDFLMACMPKKDMTKQEIDPMLIEVNKSPLLAIHDMPTSGISRNVVSKYVDYLATLD